MYDLLINLFKQTEHQQINNDTEALHFTKEDRVHYFVLEIRYEDFSELKSISSFWETNEAYKKFKKEFDRIVVEDSSTAEKNSSLIVLVKVDSLEKLERHKQQILLLEEDEHHFKKFVILYSENALVSISELATSIAALQEKVTENERFEKFFANGYSKELDDYLLLLQLFIKLPILKLKSGGESFKPIDQRINETLGEANLEIYKQIRELREELINFDFTNGPEEKLDDYINAISND
ncbi:ABC-three component system middle component 1 [Pareuzebyella sediminis]|uniref:ABC-three component system middle component 1 n=1 Tax=Pareuzebyella sediminis TaxID=2607998 RepID=UPI0011EF2F50|nr:ABC-three component system middle component 1 [Pareuzebyella sediminis]